MTTPTHVASNLIVFLALMHVQNINPNYTDLYLMLSANLIDLDHLFSRPIYHLLHKQWKIITFFAVLMLFYRPLMFLGIGLIMGYFLDFIYIKREGV